MLTTPVRAFAPHTTEAGPLTTSICSTSAGSVGMRSQRTAPMKSRYTERPSTSTSSEFARVEVPWRLVTLASRFVMRTEFNPGTLRRSSGQEGAVADRIASPETTLTAAGEFMTLVEQPRQGVTTTTSSSREGGGLGDGGGGES